MYDGFAGYRICKYCHTADPADTRSDEEHILPATGTVLTGNQLKLYEKEVFSSAGKKTITWTTDKSKSNGKRYNYKAGSCTEKGCEGDFLCSACKRVIPGKRDYRHPSMHLVTRNQSAFSCFKNGYSGDDYCELCGKLVNKGYVIEAPKKHETLFDVDGSAKAATCTVPGKDADQRCYVCDQEFSGKAAEGETVTLKLGTIPEGKRFKEWEVVSGGVVLTNATDQSGASFTMGALDVEISAVWEDHTHARGETWRSDADNLHLCSAPRKPCRTSGDPRGEP